jgi:LuxR family maltose regulon positive regulatory protein
MPLASPPSFGPLLRRYRLAANLSQAALAERARLSTRAISDLERGVRRLPYRETIRQIGVALALDPAALAALEEAARGPRTPRGTVEQERSEDPLLETKLAVPPSRSVLVARPRLVERLQQAVQGPLALIVAPAGSGKSTLFSAWHASPAGGGMPVAWVSLDRSDNDPARFWRYLFTALDRVAPGSGAAALALLGPARSGGARQSRPIEAIITCTVNDLSMRSLPLVLALDDYHLIEEPAIHGGMTFLLEHLPPCLHVLLISRADPPLALARWRAQGHLIELRAADLRFTTEEAGTFLREVMGLALSATELEALQVRTEGWIAGLQLAALALQGRPGEATTVFIRTFSGSNRYVMDYLSEEVLLRQPAPLRDFLLHTCVLDRLCAGLCAAVLGQAGVQAAAVGQALLEQLERSNIFLVALDDERNWYRYHPLFADSLRARLAAGEGPPAALLHRRAGDWLQRQGFQHEAVAHLLAAGAYEQAASLIEGLAITTVLQGAWQTLTSWLEILPPNLVEAHPRLCLVQALMLLDTHTADQVEFYLSAAEKALRTNMPREHNRNTWGEIAAVHGMVAALRGDVPQILSSAQLALDYLDSTNDVFCGIAAGCLGAAQIGLGDLARAEQTFVETVAATQRGDNAALCLAATEDLTYLQRMRGKLGAAIDTCETTLAWSAVSAAPAHPFRAAVHLSLADLLRERNELALAASHLQQVLARPTNWNLLISQMVSYLVQSRLQRATGDLAAALRTLDELTAMTARQNVHWLDPVLDAFRAQLWLARGDVIVAASWLARTAPAAVAPPMLLLSSQFMVFAYEHLAMAPIQVLLAQGRATGDPVPLRSALELAAQQQQRAETLGIPWLRLKVLVLQALARQALGEHLQAATLLHAALAGAEAERYVRLFADEGAPLAALLAGLTFPERDDAVSPGYVQTVLAACRTEASG